MKRETTIKNGLLIAIEGIDGSGKSTLAKAIHAYLESHQIPAMLTREPGGTQLGKQLRTILMQRDYELNPTSEFLLFAADRAQHIKYVVMPALAKNMVVLSDRMADSSLVYQGFGRGLDLAMLKTINSWAMADLKPVLTIFVSIDCATALSRIAERNLERTAFEKEQTEFTQKLIDGFTTLYKDRTDVLILDGCLKPGELAQQAIKKIMTLL